MRVMVIIKANNDSEAGRLPSEQLLTNMMKFNEDLVKAGVMLHGEGLHASATGRRVRFTGSERIVTEGPFAETQQLIAGFWLWQVRSMDEAVEWVKRMPQDESGEASEVEIRRVFEADDFGTNLTPETRAKEAELRKLTADQRS